jgi:hypothetical protein
LGSLFARSKTSTTLYLSVGAQTLHAAAFENGEWQMGSVVEIPRQLRDARGQKIAAELVDSMRILQHLLMAKMAKEVIPIRSVEVRVGVSQRWLASEVLPWSDVVGSSGLHALASEHLQQSGFLLGPQDVVRWEDAPWASPRWVVAYPASLIHGLNELASSIGGRLVSVLPAASLVAQLVGQQSAGVGVVGHVESGLFHLVEVDSGYVQSTMQRAIDDAPVIENKEPLTERANRIWLGMRLRIPHLYKVTELPVLFEGDATDLAGTTDLKPLAWPQRTQQKVAPMLCALRAAGIKGNALDAVIARVRYSVRNLFVLVSASIAVFALAWLYVLNLQAIYSLESMRQVTRSPVIPSGTVALSKIQQDQVLAINVAIRQLNMPAAELLKALHPPTDIRVALLGIDLSDSVSETGSPKLKLTAEALSGEDMTRYVGFLDGRRPFVQATLVRHEISQNMPENPWRFTMEVTWRP